MLKQTNELLILGPRDSRGVEVVDKATGRVSFLSTEPTGATPLDIPINISSPSFLNRPRTFLSELRTARIAILADRKRRTTSATRTATKKRSTTTPRTNKRLDDALANLDPATAALLRSLRNGS